MDKERIKRAVERTRGSDPYKNWTIGITNEHYRRKGEHRNPPARARRYIESIPKVNEVKNVIPIIVSPSPTSLKNAGVLIIDGALIQRLFKGIYFKSKKELVSIITYQYSQYQIANQRKFFS